VESKKQSKQTKQNRDRLIDTENTVVVARGEEGEEIHKIAEGDEEVRTSRYKITKSQGCKV